MTEKRPNGICPQALTEADLMRLAGAVKIDVSPAERPAVLAWLNKTIAGWEALAREDVSGEELYEPPARNDALRDDVVIPSLTVEQALTNAPRAGGGGFRTPDVMG